jgi:hypothetical protein
MPSSDRPVCYNWSPPCAFQKTEPSVEEWECPTCDCVYSKKVGMIYCPHHRDEFVIMIAMDWDWMMYRENEDD